MPLLHPNAISFDTIAGGAAAEKFQGELSKVLANIDDPNTPATKKRTITVKITFTPNKDRSEAVLLVDSNCTLVASEQCDTHVFLGRHKGNLIAIEHNPNQLGLFEERTAPTAVSFGGKQKE